MDGVAGVFDHAEAVLWQVGAHLAGDLANGGDASRMLAVIAVGEVQAEGGRPGLDQAPQLLRRLGGRTDSCHDLGATREIGQGHSGRQS